jgi:CRISPR/Cas system CMR subunit Cmr4 (Cas7 group RAMP superfamily)
MAEHETVAAAGARRSGNHLVIVSDGMMSLSAKTACEIAQHVRIDDATGTASEGGLFNQENVPAETLRYAVIHATRAVLPPTATIDPTTLSTPSGPASVR